MRESTVRCGEFAPVAAQIEKDVLARGAVETDDTPDPIHGARSKNSRQGRM